MDAKPLRQWRIEKGYGLKELAKKAGVSHATILAIETGRSRGQAGTYRKLAEALGLPGPLAILEYRQLVQAGEDTPG